MMSANTDLQLKIKKIHCTIFLNILEIKEQKITAYKGQFLRAYGALSDLT